MDKNRRSSFLTLDDSRSLYGTAILLMIFHHCFLDPGRLNYGVTFIFGERGGAFAYNAAWVARICVAVYAFITGYALAQSAKKFNEERFFPRVAAGYKKSLATFWKFYKKFFLVFIIFVPIGIVFFDKSSSLSDLLAGVAYGGEYCGEWWYIKHYYVFLLIFPVMDAFLNFYENFKKKILILPAALVLAAGVAVLRIWFWDTFAAKIFIYMANHVLGAYTYIFALSFLIGRYDIFEKIDEKLKFKIPLSILGLAAFFVVKYIIVVNSENKLNANNDVILIPFFIFFAGELFHTDFYKKSLKKFLCFFGKRSTYMWLSHTFFIYYYFQKLVLLPKYSVLVYIWAVIISSGAAVLLDFIYNLIGKITREPVNYIKSKIKLTKKEIN